LRLCDRIVTWCRPAERIAAGITAVYGRVMRAEVEKLVEEIKQSVGLLRRHL
jgi:hypothetical protein